MLPEGKRKVAGVVVTNFPPDQQEFAVGDNRFFRFRPFSRRLYFEGEMICEGLRTIKAAVIWAQAWIACMAHAKRLQHMSPKKLGEHIDAAWKEYLSWSVNPGDDDDNGLFPRLANDTTTEGNSASAESPDSGSRPGA